MTRAGDFYQESIKDTVKMLECYPATIRSPWRVTIQTHLHGCDMITTCNWTRDEIDTVIDLLRDKVMAMLLSFSSTGIAHRGSSRREQRHPRGQYRHFSGRRAQRAHITRAATPPVPEYSFPQVRTQLRPTSPPMAALLVGHLWTPAPRSTSFISAARPAYMPVNAVLRSALARSGRWRHRRHQYRSLPIHEGAKSQRARIDQVQLVRPGYPYLAASRAASSCALVPEGNSKNSIR